MMPRRSSPVSDVAVAGEVDQVAGRGENVLGALRHLCAGFGQRDFAGAPLHQFGADLALEFAHLHGKRRLGDSAILRRPAEMPVARERSQIAQLAQSDHVDKL